MNTTHFSEEQLQRYAMEKPIGKVARHLSSCPSCRFQVEVYRTILLGLNDPTEPKLNFEINEEILVEIVRKKRIENVERNYLYLLVTGMFLIFITILLILWKNFVYIFSGISATWLLFGLVFIAGIIGMQGIGLYQVAKQKMGVLE